MKVSIVIPVYNEQPRLEKVLQQLKNYHEIVVVDDSSAEKVENYIDISKYNNLHILTNDTNLGYISSIKKGIVFSTGEIIITMDGDGEHKAEDIPKMIAPIVESRCDIVFGKRPNIARESEIFLLWFSRILTGETVQDSGTGFRAIKANFAKKLHFYGSCTCGTLLQECHSLSMRVCEVDVDLPIVNKPRKIAWSHFLQFFSMWKFFLQNNVKGSDK